MTSEFINCDFSNNGIDGVSLGKNSKARFINTTTNDNGRNGVTFDQSSDVVFYDHTAQGNKAFGVQEVDGSLINQLGLPNDTNIEELKSLLLDVKKADGAQKEAIVRTSFLSDFLANTANGSTIITNLVQIADKMPQIF